MQKKIKLRGDKMLWEKVFFVCHFFISILMKMCEFHWFLNDLLKVILRWVHLDNADLFLNGAIVGSPVDPASIVNPDIGIA